ncbi:amidase domain-containing protein [Nocardioides faecalis]|nr:amidase domain-containing protein [Nocardioides faecalis]
MGGQFSGAADRGDRNHSGRRRPGRTPGLHDKRLEEPQIRCHLAPAAVPTGLLHRSCHPPPQQTAPCSRRRPSRTSRGGWYGGIPAASWTWSAAENFYKMTKALRRSTSAKYVTDLRRGDLLQYKSKSSSTMTHSMVVTKKTSNTTSGVYLSYHSTNTLNKPFSKMVGLNVTWFGHHV